MEGLRGIGRKKKENEEDDQVFRAHCQCEEIPAEEPEGDKRPALLEFSIDLKRLVINDCLDGIEKSEGWIYLDLIKK